MYEPGWIKFLLDNDEEDEVAEKLKEVNHWVISNERKKLKYVIQINNKGDIMIQISKIGETETVYFFNANFKINIQTQQEKMDLDFKL